MTAFTPYSNYGPFTDNALPSISALLLNRLESFNDQVSTWIVGMDGGNNPVVVAGTTSGSASCYQFWQGTLKGLFLYFASYRNSTSTEQKLALPTGFTTYAGWIAFGPISQSHIYIGATQQNGKIEVITGFPTPPGAGGITGSQSQMNGFQAGDLNSAFDHIGLGVSMAGTSSGGLLMIGF